VTNGIPLGSSLLLPVDTVNRVQTLKATPLFAAAAIGHLPVVISLLAHRADPNNARINGVDDEQGGREARARTNDGATPLFIAAQNGHLQVCIELLSNQADPNQATTMNGRTPLYMAALNGHLSIVQHLAIFGGSTTAGTM
jgi:ankyrin repeat protein